MGLKGKIKEFGIPEIFQLISRQKKSGALTIKSKKEKMVFIFREGAIVDVSPDMRSKDQLIGQMLVDGGVLAEGERDKALREQKRKGKKLGEVLRGNKKIKGKVLSKFLTIQIKECFFKSLDFRDGEYDFDSYTVKNDIQVGEPVRIEQLLMEGMQFLDEFPIIMKKFPAKGIYVKRKEGIDSGLLKKNSDLEGLYQVMRDYMEPIQIIRRAKLTEFEGYKGLSQLHEMGALVIREKSDKSDWVEYKRRARGRMRVETVFNVMFFTAFTGSVIYFLYSIIIDSGITLVMMEIFKGF